MELTFAIIKPDAVERNLNGKILERIESNGFKIAAMKRARLTQSVAEGFYYVHKERPFFKDLTTFMASGPVTLLVLEAEGAIKKWRDLMGATNPKDAAEGTIRKDFAVDIEKTRFTGPIRLKMQLLKYHISLAKLKSYDKLGVSLLLRTLP